MKKSEFINLAATVIGALALVLVAFGVLQPDTAANQPEARGVSNFDTVTADVVNGTTVNGTTVNAGALNATGAVVASGDLTVDDTFGTDSTAYSLTGAQTLTPTASYYQLAPLATLTLTLGAGTTGDYLILHNTVATSTIVADTGATVGGDAITLGANDLAVFIYGNSAWIEIASPDNS